MVSDASVGGVRSGAASTTVIFWGGRINAVLKEASTAAALIDQRPGWAPAGTTTRHCQVPSAGVPGATGANTLHPTMDTPFGAMMLKSKRATPEPASVR